MTRPPGTSLKTMTSTASGIVRIFPARWRLVAAIIAVLLLGGFWFVTEGELQPAETKQESSAQEMSRRLPAGVAMVERVVDGDTLRIALAGESKTVRLIGVDTPEVVDPRRPVQCFGQEASDRMKRLVDGKQVTLEADPTQGDTDTYGRLLRYVYLMDGTNLNLLMIEQGYAHEYTFRVPYAQQAVFKAAQLQAREQSLGLWSPDTCNGLP